MADYRKLIVWRKAHALALEVYRGTAHFPGAERYGLVSQTRRAAVSVPANIAEGSGRGRPKDFVRFCRFSLGSLNELEYHLLLANDLGYLDPESRLPPTAAISEVRRTLTGFMKSLESQI